ncbi:methyltransferase domain-containing protein [Candidatus Fokinia crypta]|uniref:Malonyl-[acyl-carrier protein] O-methyltransferase n=1 Tax=Candidatus Fokinia crypta TaxID=1920990 RepID=A0ABZ0UP27_9RICK|nr:methyltransferase domain-containing protein [Candidatus Fokinia cryptica]WPX97883.1 Malonyl-[acyl-carrier protein] O-methyltransferase [Candidatus Fokinia cryptica]
MTALSSKVRRCFNRASKTYDSVATVQRKAANSLVKKLIKIHTLAPKTILDLGTGTGYVAELLMQIYPKSHYTLNDIAEEMLNVCKLKFIQNSNFTFIQGNVEELNIDTYDLIISNLAIQWVEDLLGVIQVLHSKSSQIFAFTTLLDGTFQEWQDIINIYADVTLQHYPTEVELAKHCNIIKNQHHFQYWTMNSTMKFETSSLFINYLKTLGASTSRRQIPLHALKKLIREQINPFTVSYRIFFGIFKKI